MSKMFTDSANHLSSTYADCGIVRRERKGYSNLKILKPKAEQLLAMKILAARPEPAKDFVDAYILCKDLKISNKDELLDIFAEYLPLTLLGERQMNFIKYLGEDLGYDWE